MPLRMTHARVTRAIRYRARSIPMTWSIIVATVSFAAIWVVTCFCQDQPIAGHLVGGVLVFVLAAVIGQLIVAYFIGPCADGYFHGIFEGLLDLSMIVVTLCAGQTLWSFLTPLASLPRGVAVNAAALTLVVIFALRFFVRTARSCAAGVRLERRAVILGAGDSGRRPLSVLVPDPSSGTIPVVCLDEHRSKPRLRVGSVRVLETSRHQRAVVKKFNTHAQMLIRMSARRAIDTVSAVAVAPKYGRLVPFRRERPGLHGKPFAMHEFRTMLPIGAESELVDAESRMTGFGRWLRSTGLDELPTLRNDVKDDMSFAGPRPLLMHYLELHSVTGTPRHEVRPGLMGLAQVSGQNSLIWEQESLGVDRRDLVLDSRVLRDTVFAVANRNGITPEGEETTSIFRGPLILHESTPSAKTAS